MSETAQARCEQQADSTRQQLINGAEPDVVDEEDRITRATTYDANPINGWTYMLGSGPIINAHCWGRGDDAVIIIEVVGWSERAFRSITGPTAERIAGLLARAARGDL